MISLALSASDLRLLLWLRARHARSTINRALHLLGVGVEAGGRTERLYQLYAVGLMAVWAVIMWSWLLDTVVKGLSLIHISTENGWRAYRFSRAGATYAKRKGWRA